MNSAFGVKGVQLTPMGLWLKKYRGKVWVHAFSPAPNKLNRSYRSIKLKRFIKKWRGTSYPDIKVRHGRLKLFRAWWDGLFTGKNKDTTEAIFCTQLIAMAFKDAGFLYPGANACEFVPGDILGGKKFRKELVSGYHLGKGVQIK